MAATLDRTHTPICKDCAHVWAHEGMYSSAWYCHHPEAIVIDIKQDPVIGKYDLGTKCVECYKMRKGACQDGRLFVRRSFAHFPRRHPIITAYVVFGAIYFAGAYIWLQS